MKKLILLSLVCGSAMLASADILYWMVDQPTTQNGPVMFQYASLLVGADAASATEIDTFFGPDVGGTVQSVSTTGYMQSQFENDGYNSYSFFIELMSDAGDLTEIKNIGTYASLVADGYLKNSQMQTTMNTLTVNSFNVPEPTSGLLMLLGVGLLGLKRKKV